MHSVMNVEPTKALSSGLRFCGEAGTSFVFGSETGPLSSEDQSLGLSVLVACHLSLLEPATCTVAESLTRSAVLSSEMWKFAGDLGRDEISDRDWSRMTGGRRQHDMTLVVESCQECAKARRGSYCPWVLSCSKDGHFILISGVLFDVLSLANYLCRNNNMRLGRNLYFLLHEEHWQ